MKGPGFTTIWTSAQIPGSVDKEAPFLQWLLGSPLISKTPIPVGFGSVPFFHPSFKRLAPWRRVFLVQRQVSTWPAQGEAMHCRPRHGLPLSIPTREIKEGLDCSGHLQSNFSQALKGNGSK